MKQRWTNFRPLESVKMFDQKSTSTATVRKAKEQMNNVFMRNVSIFPPSGLDVEQLLFGKSTKEFPEEDILSVFSTKFKANHDQVYATFLTAAQELFNNFGPIESIHDHRWLFQFFKGIRGMNRLVKTM